MRFFLCKIIDDSPGKRQLIATAVVFAAIIVFAFYLRRHTFNLPHFSGDQKSFIFLACKLERFGLEGYNTSGIDLMQHRKHRSLIMIRPTGEAGDSIEDRRPYGFPAALMISHKLFANGVPYYALRQDGNLRGFRFDSSIRGSQFYAIIVPLAFGISLLIVTFFLAKALYDNTTVALVSMYLLAISPISLVTSQKVWADDMAAVFVGLAILFFVLSTKRDSSLLALAAGASCGVAVVTKLNAGFIVFSLILWHVIVNGEKLFRVNSFFRVVFDKHLLLFAVGILLSSGYWFAKVFLMYGTLVRLDETFWQTLAQSEWGKFVMNRPRYTYLLGIPYQNQLFALAYLAPVCLWLDRQWTKQTLLLLLWFVTYLFLLSIYIPGIEHRYMLPAYPAYAVISAFALDQGRTFLNRRIAPHTGNAVLIIALVVSIGWSIPIAHEVLFKGDAIFRKPF